MCQNFSWLGWFGHELEQQGAGRQRAGNFRNAVRTLCVENGCKPIKGQSKTTKTFFCQLIHKNYLLATELGQMLNQENFRSPIIQCRRNWFIFFVMEVFPEKMWSDWILENQRSSSGSFCIFSTLVWRKVEEQHGRRRTQEKISVFVLILQDFLYLRALQGHSGRNLNGPFGTGQCFYSWRFLREHLSRRMCNQFTFHHQFGLIPGGQNLNNRQTVFFLLVDPRDKSDKDPDTIDLSNPRHAQYMLKARQKHQNTVILSRHQSWY